MREIKFEIVAKNMAGTILREVYSLDQLMDSSWEESNSVDVIAKRQYTGLKDKNGVEIYEGDVLRHYDHRGCEDGKFFQGEVSFECGGWCSVGCYSEWPDCEVIGNIYENPELVSL